MIAHIEKVKSMIPDDIHFIELHPSIPFNYWMVDRPVRAKSGTTKGQVYAHGRGWPTAQRRWCTSLKIVALNNYYRNVENPVSCIGYAFDELDRSCSKIYNGARFPLIEYKMVEQDALEYCKKLGFDWGGLYDERKRLSCYCCPLQRKNSIYMLRKDHPDLWQKMLNLDSKIKDNRGFWNKKTVHELDEMFESTDRQLELFRRKA